VCEIFSGALMMLDAAEGLTRTESSALVDVVLKEIADAIARCETVTFTVREKSQRI
jgi:hypothetical protein